MNKKIFDVMQLVSIIILIILGLFLAYQIIRKIFSGSWSSEDIILTLLVFNLGCVFTIILNLAKLNSDHYHLERQFYLLAKDFKEHITLNKK